MRYRELIAGTDEHLLKRFLETHDTSRLDQDYYSITGFIYGLAMTLETIERDEWLNHLLGDGIAEEEIEPLSAMLGRIYDNHLAAFERNQISFPFDLSHMLENNGALEPLISWVHGLIEALYLRSSFWDGEAFPDFDNDRKQLLYHSMLMIEGIVETEMVKEVFEKLPAQVLHQVYPTLDLASDTVDRQIMMICITSCQEAVEVLQQYARDLSILQKEQKANVDKKPAGEIIKVNFSDKDRTKL